MYDTDTLIAELTDAIHETESRRAVREVVARAMRTPTAVADALPLTWGEIVPLHVSPELTVVKVAWAPGMRVPPHDHRTWAVIGIYAGQEDNSFFRRAPRGEGLLESGGKALRTGDVLSLGDDAIHSVVNPLQSMTGAIHVYGADFFTIERSEWDVETGEEKPYDMRRLDAFEPERN